MSNEKIERWVRREIRELSAYHVPPTHGFIKLDAMENPYGWPDSMVREWLDVLRGASVNRYPDPQAAPLKQQLRAVMQVPPDMELILGNGSDELIQIIALALAQPNRVILAPEPTFVMYRMIATYAGMRYVGVPLNEDFSLNLDAMLAAIRAQQPAVVFLAYPNNPTGNLFDRVAVEAIIAASPGLVVIDEAYHAFADATFMQDMARYDNVVVMRTVSKMGLAGLRLGLLAGPSAWLHEFEKVRLPYNINVLTQASAEFALRHHAVLDAQTQTLRQERATFFQQLKQLPGVRPYASHANFILLRVPAGRATELFEALKARGVLIKNLHKPGTLLSDCLRVTVGTPEENQAFMAALQAALTAG